MFYKFKKNKYISVSEYKIDMSFKWISKTGATKVIVLYVHVHVLEHHTDWVCLIVGW